MKPQTILLVRHGESQSNADPSVHARVPDHQIRLTEKGYAEALRAGTAVREIILRQWPWLDRPKDIGVIAAYISPFARTRETFFATRQTIGPMISSVYEDPRLREQEYGHLRGEHEAAKIETERDAYGRFYFRIPDGESGADVFDRQKGFLDTIHRDFEDDHYPPVALIVGHGFQIRILLMAWLHWSVEEFETKRNLRNCEIMRLELQPTGKYQLVTPLEDDRSLTPHGRTQP